MFDGYRYRLKVIAVALIAVAMFVSCIKDDHIGPDPDQPSRTVLVYLGGDNSLSTTLVSEVEAMRKGWTYTGNRCLIYIDPVDDVPRLMSLRGGCRVNPTPYIDTLAVYPEENSASAAVFGRVLNDVKQLYPADSYGLIFASHASGWLPEGTLANPTRSLGNDQNTGTTESGAEMKLSDFAAVIPDGQFDFIIFEMCLMAGVEVAYELRNKTDYILASAAELLVPGFVPIYPTSLRCLFDMKQSVENSLTTFASAYYNIVNAQSEAYRSTTLSVIKTENFDTLATLTGKITNKQISDIAAIQHFDRPGSYDDRPALPRYFDFMEYAESISTPDQCAALETAMKDIVVWKAATPTFMDGHNGFTINCHCGLTVYIEQSEFAKLNTAYHETAWYRATQ